MAKSHTIVVGGGVIGASTAYYLAQMGQQVTLLEQGEIASGASYGNAGQITPGHPPLNQPGVIWRNMHWLLKKTSPLFIPPRFDLSLFRWLWQFSRACDAKQVHATTRMLGILGEASVGLFEELAEQFDFGYHEQGRLEICRGEKSLAAAVTEANEMKEFGFDWQQLSADEVADFEPAIATPVTGAVYYPRSSYCNPQRFVVNLSKAAQNLGAEVRTGVEVTRIQQTASQQVHVETTGETLEADHAVLASGAWAPRLAKQLGLRLPVQPGKGYHLDLDLPGILPKTPCHLVEERIFVTPIDDFVRLAGTMELSGFNLRRREARIEQLSIGARKYVDGIDEAKVRSEWCHLRPMAPDGLPLLGPVPKADKIWIATGHGMLGLTQGPITGKLVAEGIVEGKPSLDLALLKPQRYS